MKKTRRRKTHVSTRNSGTFLNAATRPLTKAIIYNLTAKGLSPREVSKALSCTTRHVYWIATRYDLPHNQPIPPGSPDESRILRSLLINRLNFSLVAKLHSQSERNIRSLATRFPLLRGILPSLTTPA